MQSKDIWINQQGYDRSFSSPEILEHDKYPEEVQAYAGKTVPNVFYMDELTLARRKKIGCIEWPKRVAAIGKELNLLIVK
jgi:hypothetical protein